MTELQTGLIGLGAAAVIGVVIYNKWVEYRHRKLAGQVLKARHEDVLMDAPQRAEDASLFDEFDESDSVAAKWTPPAHQALTSHAHRPVLRPVSRPVEAPDDVDLPLPLPASNALAGGRIEPVLKDAPAIIVSEPQARSPTGMDLPPEHAPFSGAARAALETRESRSSRESVREEHPPSFLISPLVDYIASFEAVEPATGYQILESQREQLRRLRKPVRWIGFNERLREWEIISDAPDCEYRRIRVGLQLVDRQGALGDSDLSVFTLAMHDLADELMAIPDLPPRQPALDAAVELDAFCASVDIQIGINVVSQGQAFPGTKVRALAEAAGMVIDDQGRFIRRDEEGNLLYLLFNQNEEQGFSAEAMRSMSIHGLTFLLDVPRVAHGERVCNQIVDHGRRFAEVLKGALVDDNRRPLSEAALEPIRKQVGQYQAAMAARNLPAGGPLARRLFA